MPWRALDEGLPSVQLRLGRILVHQSLRTAFLMESNGFHSASLADCTSSLSVPSASCLYEACGWLLVSQSRSLRQDRQRPPLTRARAMKDEEAACSMRQQSCAR